MKQKNSPEVSIMWFRQDLRISDNPALASAIKTIKAEAGQVLPIYIFDDCAPHGYKMGAVSKVWLHHSLIELNKSLDNKLNLYIGKSSDIILSLIKQYKIKKIFWNKCFEPWLLQQESQVKKVCDNFNSDSIACKWKIFNSNYLWSPNDILKPDGSYYKVFTAYKNKANTIPSRACLSELKNIKYIKDKLNKTIISDLNLIPNNKWHEKIENIWDRGIGEEAAHIKLENFIENCLSGYKQGRDYPSKKQTSLLSPHLHFGEITPAQILKAININNINIKNSDSEHFINELIWREFSVYLLHHFNKLYTDNFNKKFDNFKWKNNKYLLKAWQTGNTGYPLIDAGMRELWQTGYMHNRVRMVVASFLVKNLGIHWHKGRDWFWDCLVDADLANNSASWQWVAGCGVDAAPYFRIFNPTTQGEKFDATGEYTRRFVPELKNLPDKYLFKPWEAPESILKSAGVILGKNYPKPIVDLSVSRNLALQMYKDL